VATGTAVSGPQLGRRARLGELIVAGLALVAIGIVLLLWSTAPALWRSTPIEFLFFGAGTLALLLGLVTLAIDRRSVRRVTPPPPSPPRASAPSSESSLMALPALVAGGSTPKPATASPEPAPVPPLPDMASAPVPAGLVTASPGTSTLLIPFAGESVPAGPVSASPSPGQTVSRLVNRMDALQRVAPTAPSPSLPTIAAPTPGPVPSPLLLRLTRVPVPPTGAATALAARRCNDCGETLGSPPQFEPCADCGRALCERCYWRTSSGPQAHLCAACFRDRSVPRPPTPAATFAKPEPAASASAPSGRWFRLRRPGN
jgi:hypothetical protein